MDRIKRIATMFLIVVIMVGLFPILPGTTIPASAVTTARISKDAAVNWLKKQDGAVYDFDSKYSKLYIVFLLTKIIKDNKIYDCRLVNNT